MKIPVAALLPFLAVVPAAEAAKPADPAPLFSWNFNEGDGNFSANQGSAGEANLYLAGTDGKPASLFTPDARGVSGKTGDRAFDLTEATGMGAADSASGPAGVAWSNTPGLPALSGLSSFTLSGWIKPDAALTGAARLVVTNAVILMAGARDGLMLQVNGTSALSPSFQRYGQTEGWIFFAVTYDGTRAADNVTYYVGSAKPGSLASAGTTTLAAGKLNEFKGQLLVGNNAAGPNGIRPFKGLIDNLAIHASKDDASGALPLAKIEAVRAAALR